MELLQISLKNYQLDEHLIVIFNAGSTSSDNNPDDGKSEEKRKKYEDFDDNVLSDEETKNDIELTTIFIGDKNSPR